MTPADKPDLPPRLVASFDNEAEMVVLYADHVRAVLEARADERRKVLEEAAEMADRYGSQTPIQIRLRIMEIDRKEPTT